MTNFYGFLYFRVEEPSDAGHFNYFYTVGIVCHCDGH